MVVTSEIKHAEPPKLMVELEREMVKRNNILVGRYDGKPRKMSRELFGRRGRRIEFRDGEWRLVKGARKHRRMLHSKRILSRRKGGGGKKKGANKKRE